jgi:DNA (cytosine-5)-methyltransferase 1
VHRLYGFPDRQTPFGAVACRRVPNGTTANGNRRPGNLGKSRRPVAIDLFSGAGGLSLGFEQAGFDILAAVEYDPIHAAVHSFNFPLTEVVCADVATVDGTQLKAAARRGWSLHHGGTRWDGELDAIIGGPPCQGFSVGGKRAFDDARNQLVFNFARLVGELQPRYFVMENVPGMPSLPVAAKKGAPPLMNLLLEEFNQYGYHVLKHKVLNATAWGVPQERRRLILLGTRRGEAPPAYPREETQALPKRVESNGRTPRSSGGDVSPPFCPTVWEAIGDLPDLDGFDTLRFSDEVQLRARQLTKMHRAMSGYARTLHGLDHDRRDLSRPRLWDPQVLTSSCRTDHADDVVARFDKTTAGHPERVSRLFRLDRHGVSCTLRAGTHYERGSFNAPRPIHPVLPRVISVREAARLHSLPDWFRLHWTKWHGFRQVGNALPPRLGRAIGAELVRALAISPSRPSPAIELGDPWLLVMENLQAAEHFSADLTRIPRNELRSRRPRTRARAAA